MNAKTQKDKWKRDLDLVKRITQILNNKPSQKSEKELFDDIVDLVQEKTNAMSRQSARQKANMCLAYLRAPQDIRNEYENKKPSFTKIGEVCLQVCEKKRSILSYDFAVPDNIARTIIGNAIKVSNSKNAAACAGKLREAVKAKLLEVNNNELEPTAKGWQSLHPPIDPDLIKDSDTFEAEIDRAIIERHGPKPKDHKVRLDMTFMWNLRVVLDKSRFKSNEQKLILKILTGKPLAKPSELLVIYIELKRKIPKSIAEQLALMAYKEFLLAENNKEKAGRNDRLRNQLNNLKNTDEEVLSKRRTEQDKLRKELLDGKGKGKCALCGNEYEDLSLVAAHKKKRQYCSEQERLDPDIVMLLCKFGCDHLYEEGFILIENGKVVENPIKKPKGEERAFIEKLIKDKHCLDKRWLERNSEKFLSWHYENHFAKRSGTG
ncbi:MAG: hypothetical protein JNM09_14105 [Blastocatellia bacterium]|nr:hypothetical protein [Blastocatellia bacterium]